MASNWGRGLAALGVIGVVVAVVSAAKSADKKPPPPKDDSFTPRHAVGTGIFGSIIFFVLGAGGVAAAWMGGFCVLAFIMFLVSGSYSTAPHVKSSSRATNSRAAQSAKAKVAPKPAPKPSTKRAKAPAPAPSILKAAPPAGPTWADAMADLALVQGDLLAYELDPEALYLRKPLLQDASWPPAERFYIALARARDYADRYPDGRGGDPGRLIRLIERAAQEWDAANILAAEQGSNAYSIEQRAALRRIARCVDLLLDGTGGPHEALEARSVLERLLLTLPGIGVPTPLRNQLALPAGTAS